MKSFDSRTYSVNDFLEWDNSHLLDLNPIFQRRSVWTDTARSYLMDTIARGKPIPKVFIRQRLNPSTQQTIREVVDGQQRLKTILSYLRDGFVISRKHNAELGGLYFSQLDERDHDAQSNLLTYEISVDLLINMPNSEVLDVFSRLNSYAVILNDQERMNANHFGAFKILADNLGRHFYDFWRSNNILTSMQILRMGEVALVADLLIAMIEGIKSKKQIKSYYDEYERKFDRDTDDLFGRFESVMGTVSDIFVNGLQDSEFHRLSLFYSLFTVIYHWRYELKDFGGPRGQLDAARYPRMLNVLEGVSSLYTIENRDDLDRNERQFIEDSRRATTDAATRARRARFISDRLIAA